MRPEHIFIIVIVAILLFGFNRIPNTIRGLGKAVRGFKEELSRKDKEKDDTGASSK
jgi:TatA/E family protein of Tat protein translocase